MNQFKTNSFPPLIVTPFINIINHLELIQNEKKRIAEDLDKHKNKYFKTNSWVLNYGYRIKKH